jgi:hypothetical protein
VRFGHDQWGEIAALDRGGARRTARASIYYAATLVALAAEPWNPLPDLPYVR